MVYVANIAALKPIIVDACLKFISVLLLVDEGCEFVGLTQSSAGEALAKLRWNVELDEDVVTGEGCGNPAIPTTNQRGKPQSQTSRLLPPNPQ